MTTQNNHADLVALAVSDIQVAEDSKPKATSLQVAMRFKKQHKNVLRAIANLECSEQFRRLNFEPSSYVNEQGKMQPCFLMTKNGFSFLAMGLTGKEAAQWKEAYIDAFDQMTETIGRFVSFGVPGELYSKAMEAEKQEAGSFAKASVAGRALSLRRKEKKAFQGIVAMVREEVQLRLLLGHVSEQLQLAGA